MYFLDFFFAFIVLERLIELYIAKKNAIYIEAIGGFEVGKAHYKYIVLLHILFLISFYIESRIRDALPAYWLIPFIFFILIQIVRYWIISSLGRFWNTRVYVVPNSEPINKGPYRYLRHPNYLVVILEMITIPLIFGAYFTAFIFPVLNAFLLSTRIKVEEEALFANTQYQSSMKNKPRFLPKKQ